MSTDIAVAAADGGAEEKPPIQMDVKVESPQSCVRQVVVTIPQGEVQRYMKDAYDEVVPEAQIPGFRSGRAPRKLVEKQFKDRVSDQVKNSLLMDSLSQVTEQESFNAIGEPDFDYDAIKIQDEGDFIYQFQIEVRPEFPTPTWKGMTLTKPVESITDEDVDAALARVLSKYATLEATDEAAELGDTLVLDVKFELDGKLVTQLEEERVKLSEKLSFVDGTCEDFGDVMAGCTEDDVKSITVKIADGVDDEAMRGQEITAKVKVIEVLKPELPALTDDFLEELGDFESEEELRGFVRESLVRQADYRTQQAVRGEVVKLLTETANFDLPEALVRRQTMRELERKVLELRRSGFDEEMVRRFVNASRQNAQASTELALREHFILEQIAEEEKIDADEAEYEAEIALIAQQRDEPPRRVRARLEKTGQMDALRNQIVERKVVEAIVEAANVTEEKVENNAGEDHEEFALEHSVLRTRDVDAIPEAKYADNSPAEEKTEKDSDKD